jgi:hypothetical protein
MAVCSMLLQHNPYSLPQHYNRHVFGPSCNCERQFYGYLRFLSIRFVWIIWVQYATDNLSCQHRPVLIFQPTVNSSACDKQTEQCLDCVSQLEKVRSYYMSTYKLGAKEGSRRWSGYILALQRNFDLQGSCSLASLCSLSDRSEQNASELQHTVCNTFISHLAF